MEDNAIIDLYWARSENAISQTAVKYGGYCYAIAYHILESPEDSEESVNDTYLAAWNTMPPKRPNALSAFLGKITRYISLDRWKHRSASKRGGGQTTLALEELEECVSGGENPEERLARKELLSLVNRFLGGLSETERRVFVCRYWYLDSLEDIAAKTGLTKGHISTMLHRTRKRLCICLQKEGLL